MASEQLTREQALKRMQDDARNYALADRSDPFAYNRAMSAISNGISGFTPSGDLAFYTADAYQETINSPDVGEYTVIRYKNMQRP